MQLILHNQIYSTNQLPDLIRKKQTMQLPEWEEALIVFLANWFDEGETIKAQTSGSTGAPKPILLSKANMLASAKLTNQFFNLKPKDTALMCLSANYIAGKMMVVRAIAGDLNLIVIKPTSTPTIDHKIDFAAMIPMQVDTLLKTNEGVVSIQKISKLIIGGSAISPDLESKLQPLSTNCYSTYGMTETVSNIALRSINGTQKSNFYEALEGVSFEQDNRDCLLIHAPHLQAQPFITNDIVLLNSNTSFEWLGRFDNVINSGGIKLFPETIEQKLSKIILERFFVSSLPNDKLGEKVVLIIEGKPYSTEKMIELETKLSTHLTRFEKPREIIFTPKFSETTSGKIKRLIPSNEDRKK